jgi:hypothetical protein
VFAAISHRKFGHQTLAGSYQSYTNVCDDGPEDVVEKTLEEEPVIVEPEPLATPPEA